MSTKLGKLGFGLNYSRSTCILKRKLSFKANGLTNTIIIYIYTYRAMLWYTSYFLGDNILNKFEPLNFYIVLNQSINFKKKILSNPSNHVRTQVGMHSLHCSFLILMHGCIFSFPRLCHVLLFYFILIDKLK